MVLLGVIVNAVAIILGAVIGQLFQRINADVKETLMKAIGIAILVIGMSMALKTEQIIVVLFSLAGGAIVGEWLRLEEKLNQLGQWIEHKLSKGKSKTEQKGNLARAFVTTTLIYCIGAMAVVGALDSGLRGDHSVLYTKSFLDGFTAIIFSSTLGIGVALSAIPVFIYQGSIALLASFIQQWIPEQLLNDMIVELTATGGILIIAIGLNLLEVTKIRVGNLLPALIFVVMILFLQSIF